MESVLNWVSTYGYPAIFSLLVLGIVGLPVPDEWLLVFSGYLVYAGHLNGYATFTSALLGSVCGITVSYLAGRKLGLPFLHSKLGGHLHITDLNIRRAHDWFHRIGMWTLIVGYYIPGVRHFTALIAGTSCVEFPIFARFAYFGALLWVSSFMFIGFHFGERWRDVLSLVEKNLHWVGIAAGVLAAGYLIFVFLFRRRVRT